MVKAIRIIAKVDGTRRAGITHTGVQDYPLSTFTRAQIDQLRAEPKLVIQDIDLPDGKPALGKDSAPAKTKEPDPSK